MRITWQKPASQVLYFCDSNGLNALSVSLVKYQISRVSIVEFRRNQQLSWCRVNEQECSAWLGEGCICTQKVEVVQRSQSPARSTWRPDGRYTWVWWQLSKYFWIPCYSVTNNPSHCDAEQVTVFPDLWRFFTAHNKRHSVVATYRVVKVRSSRAGESADALMLQPHCQCYCRIHAVVVRVVPSTHPRQQSHRQSLRRSWCT
jgi:hypothetical protein